MNPITKLKNLEERARQRVRERQGQDSAMAPTNVAEAVAKVVQLPLWPETVRACPSCALRSALFGVVRRGRRKALERVVLAAWEGITIR